MKTSTFAAIAAMAFVNFSLAQEDPGPSPSESVGCEPHGDHWHCEGPRETGSSDEESSSIDPGPSPTNSVGCEPHGDHWHCEGPAETGSAPEASTTGDSDHDHDHDHDEDEDHDHDHDHDHDDDDAAEAGPSPSESVGCEPHGDHWHCEGPRETPAGNSSVTTTDSGDAAEETESSPDAGASLMVPIAGLLAAAAFVL